MKKVIIYSTPSCTYCKMAKEFFKEHGVEYTEHDVSTDLTARKDMIDKSEQMGVPVTDIEGKIIIGFDKEEFVKELGL